MPAMNTPPAIVSPAPVSMIGTEFQQNFDAAATPSVRAWVEAEATSLAAAPLDLQRLQRDTAARAAGSSSPQTAALLLRYAVELRLQQLYDARIAAQALQVQTPLPMPPTQSPGIATTAALIAAAQQAQAAQMNFNMQYLHLQNSMQNDNRQYSMISNSMDTRADTVKKSLANVK